MNGSKASLYRRQFYEISYIPTTPLFLDSMYFKWFHISPFPTTCFISWFWMSIFLPYIYARVEIFIFEGKKWCLNTKTVSWLFCFNILFIKKISSFYFFFLNKMHCIKQKKLWVVYRKKEKEKRKKKPPRNRILLFHKGTLKQTMDWLLIIS